MPVTMKCILVIATLALLTSAQQSPPASASNTPVPSQTVITSTFLTTFATLGPDRQASTATRTIVVTSTQAIIPPSNNNTTASGNNTVSAAPTGNSTSSTSASATKTSNLPTAPTTIDAGGGPAGAPLPGATGGAYGPDDSYIAAALSLQRNTLLVMFGGLVVSGALMAL